MFQFVARHTRGMIKRPNFSIQRDQLQRISSYWCSCRENNKHEVNNNGFNRLLLAHKADLIKEYRKSFTVTTCYRQLKEDNKTRSLTVWSDLKQLKASPLPALTLGLSGLIPFVAAPAYMISTGVFLGDLAFAQIAYGACILSFIGGARWGFTLYEENPVQPDWVNLGYSIIPSLIAWCGLLLPSPFSYLSLIGGLTLAAYVDMAMFGYPSWFKGLRFVLSIVAILSLWTSVMCSLILKKPSTSSEDKKSASDDE